MIRLYVAASLDGFIADSDGGVGWLDPFDSPDTTASYEAFIAQIGTIVMGRTTFDQVLTFGEWPYAGQRTLVLTSRPLSNPPPDTEALSMSALPDAIPGLRAESRDVWLVGGGQTVRAFLDLGAIDEIELYVMPVILGAGLPLFPSGGELAGLKSVGLRLEEMRPLAGGMAMLRYRT